MSTPVSLPFASIEAVVEIHVASDRTRTWRALTDEMGAWWSPDFYQGKARSFLCEARPGGRVFEDWGDGDGALWYTVTHVKTGELLALSGELTAEYGGPARMTTRFELEQHPGGGTTVRVRETAWGRVDEGLGKGLEEGWGVLLGGLKGYLE